MTEPNAEFMTTEALAEWLGISARTVTQWRYKGTGPAGHKIGKHVRYRRSDVEAWIAGQREPSAA